MISTLQILAGLLSPEALAGDVLYCVDTVLGTDHLSNALGASGHTVLTTTDMPGVCESEIGSGAYDLVVVAIQGDSFTMPNYAARLALGEPTLVQDWNIGSDAASALAYGLVATGAGLGTLSAFDTSISAGLPGSISLTNPGWGSWSWSVSSGYTTLASFEDGNAAIVRYGDVMLNGFLTDTANVGSEADLERLYGNQIEALIVPAGDGDGYDEDEDCDDADAAVNPGALEVTDGRDNNCDGTVDEAGPDSDGDGLSDGDEGVLGTNSNNVDTDGDGMEDGAEVSYGTDPLDRDSDEDGLSDGAELNVYLCDPLEQDTDGDDLGDALEVGRDYATDDTTPGYFEPDADPDTTTDPADADTDDDGLLDSDEDGNEDGAMTGNETDPVLNDTDGDGVLDGTERGVGASRSNHTDPSKFKADADTSSTTDPLQADSDGGLVPDGEEDLNANGRVDTDECDPNDPADDLACADDDADGLSNLAEQALGTDPADPDSDDDGIADGLEYSTGTNPAASDSDGDGLRDGYEDADHDGQTEEGETDPRLADTDGGGRNDGEELDAATDPLDPTDDIPNNVPHPELEEDDLVFAGRGCSSGGSAPALAGMLLALAAIALRRRMN